jgi:hypothetical protein
MRAGRCLNISVLGIALLLPAGAYAAQPEVEGVPAPVEMPAIQSAPAAATAVVSPAAELPSQPGFIDSSRDYVADKFVGFANYIDEFFGNDRSFQESNKSVLQFDLGQIFERGGRSNIALTYKAKFHLPGLQDRLYQYQKKLHVLLESNPDKNQNLTGGPVQPGKTSLFREVSSPDTYGAALRFENEDDSPWRFSADGGLKLDNISIRPFLRSRVSLGMQAGSMQLKLAESLFWFDSTGVGESTQLDADHPFSDTLMFRSSTGATWLLNTENFDLRQDFSLYQTLTGHSSLLYQTSAIGVSKPQTQVSEYVALLLYRQRIHRDWMFFEISPQLHYPRVADFQPNAQLILRLEVLFSK